MPPRALHHASTLLAASPDYPRRLTDLPDPPPEVRVRGTIPPTDRAVAIVGTRRADSFGSEFARRLASDLARAGVVVVSGGALGIDAAAHEGALDGGGQTVAVLATGLLSPYPRANRPLFDRIAASGALLTEAEETSLPHQGRFLKRNRIIAALSRAVVVVQAPRRSGALSTAAWATRLGRPVLAVPASPWDPRGEGCLELLRHGAPVCSSVRDVLSVAALGSVSTGLGSERSENLGRSPDVGADARKVVEQLGTRARSVDDVARGAEMAISSVQRILTELLLEGLVEEDGPGRFRLAPSRSRPPGPY